MGGFEPPTHRLLAYKRSHVYIAINWRQPEEAEGEDWLPGLDSNQGPLR
jgi:hypothetical protein